jgi:excinuclease ABC subunit A
VEKKQIVIIGAREHNLKNISINIPRDQFVVITGLSGSGKSSLAFDTIYAEGQRRYLESLSAYARQFLEQMRKPEVDSIDGLSPSISIEQKNISRNPRSTVGTVTETYDFLRLLYARVGVPHCYSCGKPIQSQTIQQIVDQVFDYPPGTKFSVLAPIVRGKKGEYQKELLEFRSQGFVRARIDGNEVNLSTPVKLQKSLKHDISIYVDRLVLKEGVQSRLAEALEIATKHAGGLAEIAITDEPESRYFSTQFACADCGVSFPELEPRGFSFNSPHGACPDCNGIGTQDRFDAVRIVDPSLSIRDGAIQPLVKEVLTWKPAVLEAVAEKYKIKLDVPFERLSAKSQQIILQGSGSDEISFKAEGKGKSQHVFKQTYQGVIPALETLGEEDPAALEPGGELAEFVSHLTCPTCKGARLKKEMLYVLIGGKNIAEFSAMNVEACRKFLTELKLPKSSTIIAGPILKEVDARLSFLINVGLTYLTLDRSAATLSGGEAQRIRLATQIGSNLVGVLYILDEPSIGLHQRDNQKLIDTLIRLRDQGNSVLVVEHDEETIQAADFVVDLGPGAGTHGGELVFVGDPSQLKKDPHSLTGKYLSHRVTVPIPENRRTGDKARTLSILGATSHNLKNIDVHFPLGTFICVTGVSGSGKSSLIIDTLLPGLEHQLLGQKHLRVSNCRKMEGLEHLDKVVHVDQSPIGRSPRSNPATYTGVFGDIRSLFSELPESKVRGYTASRFSFNVQGGRCEACSGDGNIKITMHFLPDVFVECEVCHGKRYNRETLEIYYRGKNIAEVLAMTVEEALGFFERIPSIRAKMHTLNDVGLGYIGVGQSSVTLSGGEAQRIKLAKELNRRATGRTIYILDEPTTGLHFEDVRRLLQILQALVEQGNTVVVIEHNLDVIKQADHVIDLGPEGGDAGGLVLFEGTPEDLCKVEASQTGMYLTKTLQIRPHAAEKGKKTKKSTHANLT